MLIFLFSCIDRKHKEQQVIIPNNLFYSDESSYLPTFEEVKVQEELPFYYDHSSPDEYSKYAEFQYSMGGNVKMYENLFALSSPKKKPQKPIENEKGNERSTFDKKISTFKDMDQKEALSSNEGLFKKHGDDLDFGSNLNTSLENLDISDHVRKSRNPNRSTGSDDDIEIRKRVDTRERDYSPIRTTARGLDRQEDLSTTESKRGTDRDYSPIQSTEKIQLETNQYYKAKSTLAAKKDNHEPAVNAHSGAKPNEHAGTKTNPSIHKGGDINALESLSRYDLTLHYVNQQNRTLQNGDYNDLDIALSDLSSDVFTDSELQFTTAESNEWTRDRPDKDFYPDSPVSECAYFKTPCSSRKNSYDSLMSDESLTDMETDVRGNIQAPITRCK